MQFHLIRLIAVPMFLAFTVTGAHAQKRSKKHPAQAVKHVTAPIIQATPPTDISSPTPSSVPIPQQSSLTPDMQKTKKVVIVPAPPPPPGRDPVPPAYPKR